MGMNPASQGGSMTLGCLLGQYDGAQSFDVASVAGSAQNSWALSGSLVQLSNNIIRVHSSNQGIIINNVIGEAIAVAAYDYRTADDAFLRWFPEVISHDTQVDFWALSGYGGTEGQLYQDFGAAGDHKIIAIGGLASYRNTYVVTSANNTAYFRIVSTRVNTTVVIIDDVLFQTDKITLHPEYSFVSKERVNKALNRTLGGNLHSYVWGKYFAYDVPLRFLSTSHTDLINWWWENQFNLLFTLDTSDTESNFICRIVNETQPIESRIAPYPNQWQGLLQLESVNQGNLNF